MFTATFRFAPRVGVPSRSLSIAPGCLPVLRGVQWGLAGLLLGSSLLTAMMWMTRQAIDDDATRYAEAGERTTALNQAFTAQLERDQLTLSAAQVAGIQQEIRVVNQLAEKRDFSWTQLLADLEEALPSGISVSRIQRDGNTSALTITGHVTGMDTLQRLLSALQAHAGFHDPVLHRHDLSESSGSAGRGVRDSSGVDFSVTVQYRGMGGKRGSHEVS
ncbi:MAG: PilN domain-containing protein [Nitrospira sp.]|nr:PilN domain-containing protein [Nitrospira sp.]MBS0167415.1 PilN domain-containing protein [Nitrospira sp.]